jgi:hypothetical protein
MWVPNNPKFKWYDNETACDALGSKGINLISFYGDSFLRQIYAALLITLNGDYKYGSLNAASKVETCAYHRQFNEKKCGYLELNHIGWVCNKKILLDPLLTGVENLNNCNSKNGTVGLFSFGNHQLNRGRYGVNNATAYSNFFENSMCQQVKANKAIDGSFRSPCSFWWVSTHFRRVGYFPDEKEDVVREYNLGMRRFFDSQACGPVHYIDVYNMTSELVRELPEHSGGMTYDNVHWGMEVNLIKAQIALNAILENG